MSKRAMLALRLWLAANILSFFIVMASIYVRSILVNESFLYVSLNSDGEWYIEVLMALSVFILGPIYMYLDRENIRKFFYLEPRPVGHKS